jgi:hypothetical protein
MPKLTEAELAALAGSAPAAVSADPIAGAVPAAASKAIIISAQALDLAAEKRKRVVATELRLPRGPMKAFF